MAMIRSSSSRPRIVIVGSGFGGVYTALHLERLTRRSVEALDVTLVGQDNYFLMTPLLFEAGSGVLEPRHAVNPIRPLLRSTRFIEARVTSVDTVAQVVHAVQEGDPPGATLSLPYDHVVIGVGGVTNTSLVPGGEHALTFKTLADAIRLRNRLIDLFEKADAETDPARRSALLTVVVIGAGLVGVELVGELTEFLPTLIRSYPRLDVNNIRLELVEAMDKILPEMEPPLRDYAARLLGRRNVRVRTRAKVQAIEPGRVVLAPADDSAGEVIPAATVVVVTGIKPGPLVASLDLPKDRRGRIATADTMLVNGATNVWAIGDCAAIPDPHSPDGRPYPQLAQHALREAKVLAGNLLAATRGQPPRPFAYRNKGVMAALGRGRGVGKLYVVRIYGPLAWLVWRGYYLMQMPQLSRKLRILADWSIALVFKNDVAKLDAYEPPARAGSKL
jgi:NADH dehydrogenase